ncbi:unnamed protein product [Boreogadus saida]
MDAKGEEKLGTGLTDVIRLLLDLPKERLLSLTYQLGKTPEEVLVRALSLLFLHKETQGLDQLQALQDNSLANHLAEKWHTAGGHLEDFREQCGHLDNVAAGEETPLHLARMFGVLSKERLCDPHLRDLAYSRVVSVYGETNIDSKVQPLIEEAKYTRGPQFAEKMSMRMHPPSVGGADEESRALSLTHGKSDSNLSMPCSLKASSSFDSYPTHLEISLATTGVLISDQITPVASQPSHLKPQSLAEDELENNAPGSYPSSNSSEASSMLTSEDSSNGSPCSIATTDVNSPQEDEKQTTTTTSIHSKSPPAAPKSPSLKFAVPKKTDTGKETEEEEEEEEEEVDTFYAFVILHAAEDLVMAEAMRERVESLFGGTLVGATFSEDFAVPGRSTIMSIEDAIENSAFTILLLTNHFVRNRRFQVEAEAALIHSIEHRLKNNTVIPLLPRDNGMAKAALPMVLKTLNCLEDKKNSSFDKKIRRVLSADSLRTQRSVWSKAQQVKKELRRQERMKEANKHRKLLYDMSAATAKERLEGLRVVMEQGGASPFTLPVPGWQQPQNITISHANYVIVGNDSTMTVDHGDSITNYVDKDEDN